MIHNHYGKFGEVATAVEVAAGEGQDHRPAAYAEEQVPTVVSADGVGAAERADRGSARIATVRTVRVNFTPSDIAAAVCGERKDHAAAIEHFTGASRYTAIPEFLEVAGVLSAQFAVFGSNCLWNYRQSEGRSLSLSRWRRAVCYLDGDRGRARTGGRAYQVPGSTLLRKPRRDVRITDRVRAIATVNNEGFEGVRHIHHALRYPVKRDLQCRYRAHGDGVALSVGGVQRVGHLDVGQCDSSRSTRRSADVQCVAAGVVGRQAVPETQAIRCNGSPVDRPRIRPHSTRRIDRASVALSDRRRRKRTRVGCRQRHRGRIADDDVVSALRDAGVGPVSPSDPAFSPDANCRGSTPMPIRFDRWIRSKLSAITARTPNNAGPFAAQSRDEPDRK